MVSPYEAGLWPAGESVRRLAGLNRLEMREFSEFIFIVAFVLAYAR
jgi:hypothetical protein